MAVFSGLRAGRFYLTAAIAALVLASLSLLLPSTPSYDPWAWLIWGREIAHLSLNTATGPSWKPLPVVFTTLFAPFGAAQPDLWLVVARAGALMALAMVFRVAFRVTSGLLPARAEHAMAAHLAPALLAGLIAAASLGNSGGFIVENALGYSEGLAVTLMLVAVDRVMDGAPRQALLIGFLACLDRPELWFIWAPFGAWLGWRDPSCRRLVLGLVALLPLLWLLPELLGSGQLLRGVTRAHHPNPGTPAFSRCPLCTVLDHEAWPTLMRRVKFPALLALVAAAAALRRTQGSRRPDDRRRRASWAWLLGLGSAGLVWWLGIAAETQAGFAGNRRYLELGTALVAIAGGVAWGWIAITAAQAVRRLGQPRFTPGAGALLAVGVLVAAPPWIGRNVVDVAAARDALDYQAELRSDLTRAVSLSGGPRALRSCGPVMAEAYQVPMVAWVLGLPQAHIEPPPSRMTRAPWPAVVLEARAHWDSALLPAPDQIAAWEHAGAPYGLLARTRSFTVFSTCTHKVRR